MRSIPATFVSVLRKVAADYFNDITMFIAFFARMGATLVAPFCSPGLFFKKRKISLMSEGYK